MKSNVPRDPVPVRCACCEAELRPGRGDHYAVGIVAVADPAPPIITEDELNKDVSREIRVLVNRLKGRSERSLEDEVVRRVAFRLCLDCYASWIEQPVAPHGRS